MTRPVATMASSDQTCAAGAACTDRANTRIGIAVIRRTGPLA
jgi:hypothetical protein